MIIIHNISKKYMHGLINIITQRATRGNDANV